MILAGDFPDRIFSADGNSRNNPGNAKKRTDFSACFFLFDKPGAVRKMSNKKCKNIPEYLLPNNGNCDTL